MAFRDADTGVIVLRGPQSLRTVVAGNAGVAENLAMITTDPVSKCFYFSQNSGWQGEFLVVDSVSDGPIKGGIIISN